LIDEMKEISGVCRSDAPAESFFLRFYWKNGVQAL
jgi:hypothetical protein